MPRFWVTLCFVLILVIAGVMGNKMPYKEYSGPPVRPPGGHSSASSIHEQIDNSHGGHVKNTKRSLRVKSEKELEKERENNKILADDFEEIYNGLEKKRKSTTSWFG